MAKRGRSSRTWLDFAFEALVAVGTGVYHAWTEDKAREARPRVDARPPKQRKPVATRKRAPAKWWKVLGVSPTATPQEIKAAYRARMHESHPDKVAHLSSALRKTADREAKRINDAYERAMQ